MSTYIYLFLLNLLIFFLDFDGSVFVVSFFRFFDNVFALTTIFQIVCFLLNLGL